MAIPDRISLGDIILADIREPINRVNVGPHYAMVLNPQASRDAGDDLSVAVKTTSFHLPLPSGWFPMPTAPGGHPTTGLTEACVVKATWQDHVPQSAIIKRVGRSLKREYKLVFNWLAEKQIQMRRLQNPP